MSTVVFYQLLLSAINIGCLLTALELMGAFNAATIVACMGILNISIPTAFYCKYSENISADLEAIGDTFWECSWYLLPLKQQEMFILSILRSQKECRMMGLGMVECSLATFLSVNIVFLKNNCG